MPSTWTVTSRERALRSGAWWGRRMRAAVLVAGTWLLAGCAQVPNQWREDGPSHGAEWRSPTAVDVEGKVEPAELRHRDYAPVVLNAVPLGVTHWPLYFEDPFEDRGKAAATLVAADAPPPAEHEYALGWQDYIAMPYTYARFTTNWLMLFPASTVVTPPWTVMVSDGQVSQQALGYDHDAIQSIHGLNDPMD